jgi:hypothetical protein
MGLGLGLTLALTLTLTLEIRVSQVRIHADVEMQGLSFYEKSNCFHPDNFRGSLTSYREY